MNILVLNSGSSSIKATLFAAGPSVSAPPRTLLEAELAHLGTAHATLQLDHPGPTQQPAQQPGPQPVEAADAEQAIHALFDALHRADAASFQAIGYRIVHPGPHLTRHQRITPEVLAALDAAVPFAPLHDPSALTIVRAAMQRYPTLAHFACFDTVFHQTLPPEASTYPIPAAYREQGVHRYGFHGLSCESVVRQLRDAGRLPRRLAIAHLGSGCSVTAVLDGRSVDTTMGLTPTGGVVMGTRPGDLDPGLVLYLLRRQTGGREAATAALESLLNYDCGLVALSGCENDMQAVRRASDSGSAEALLALKVFTRSITKVIGGYAWLLGGLDAVAFTGGIGEHDPRTRAAVLANLAAFGVLLDRVQNELPQNGASGTALRAVHAAASNLAVFVVPAREDRMIAMHVLQMANPAA